MAGRIVLLLACLFVMPLVQAELSDSKRALIQELFPSATIIEDKLPDFPVYPVYPRSNASTKTLPHCSRVERCVCTSIIMVNLRLGQPLPQIDL